MDDVTSYSDCCAQGGKAWGLYGSDMCNPCLPVDATKDDQIEKDLDTPSCKYGDKTNHTISTPSTILPQFPNPNI